MKRLFVFGCSITAYAWPSYADLLAPKYDEYHNYGLAGLGNRAIVERLSECNAEYNFTKEDTIIVQWSTHLRHDFFTVSKDLNRAPGWRTCGSIFNYKNRDLYSQEWLDYFFYESAYFMHTLNFISLAQNLLENTGCKYYMTSIGDLRNLGTDLVNDGSYGENVLPYSPIEGYYVGWEIHPQLEFYNKSIWEDRKDIWIEPVMLFANKQDNPYFDFKDNEIGEYIDYHPKTSVHKLWIEQNLKDKLDIKDSDLAKMDEASNVIQQLYDNCIKNKKGFEAHIYMNEDLKRIFKPNWPNLPRGILT